MTSDVKRPRRGPASPVPADRGRRHAQARRRLWRPEDHSINRKMWAILVIPVMLLVALASLVVATGTGEALDAKRLVALARLSVVSGELASRLSDERAAAAMVLLGKPTGFDTATLAVDDAMVEWRQAAGKAGEADAVRRRVEVLLDGLPDLRTEAEDGPHAAGSVIVLRYQLVISALLDVRQALVVAGAPADIADRIRASVALSQAAESSGLLQVGVLRAAAVGALTPAGAAQISSARAGFAQALQVWDVAALPDWRVRLDQALSGEQLLTAQRLDGTVSRTQVGERLALPRDLWMQAQGARQERLRQVIGEADADVVEMLEAWGRQRVWLAGVTGGGSGVALAVSLMLASYVARRTVRSLVRLRQLVTGMAQTGLPRAVASLASGSLAGEFDGERAAEQLGVALPVRGADEVAEVTMAFNAVQATALGQAIELVQARDRVTGLIVDLGRRQQMLVDRMLAGIDKAERQETDADRLERLFAIDHLAARMQRANMNLLLLGGVPPAVTRSEPESLAHVLMGANSFVENYQRVVIAQVDDVIIRPAAITPVVQALAELIDNALVFSPGRGPVQVTGHRIGDRVIVEVTDTGIGMKPDAVYEANELLAGRAVGAVPHLRRMGLQVVARIAAEQGLAVRLVLNEPFGITAEVILPRSVLQPAGHRRTDVAEVFAPRLMDRISGDAAWPPVRPRPVETQPSALVVTSSGLPVRPRDSEGAAALAAAVPKAVVAVRDRETRARALTAIQRGRQASRAGRPTHPYSPGEKS